MRGHDEWLHARGPREERELRCSSCSYRWWVLGHEEYGWFVPESDDELCCPECEEEAE